MFRIFHLRNFVLQAGDGRSGGGFLRLQFRGIEHGNQISGFHRSAFIDQQFLNAALHLRTHDDLIRVDCTDQHQVRRVFRGKKIISRGNYEDDSEKNKKFVTRAHEQTPCVAWRCVPGETKPPR